MYGQLAGANYGVEGIPRSWRDVLSRRDEIVNVATRLFERAYREKIRPV